MAVRENKFKAFFRARAHSRSRSRSQPPDPIPPDDASSNPAPSRLRHSKAPSVSEIPPSSYLKSSVRSQNRPVSSTTTATHSTITPLPSDALRNRSGTARHAYTYHHHSTDTTQDHDPSSDTCDYDSDDINLSRSETPSSTRRRLLWNSFFGISLTRRSSSSISNTTPTPDRKGSTSASASQQRVSSPRRRSFRLISRPTTPKSVDSSNSLHPIPTPSSPLPLSASPRRRSFGLGNSSRRGTPKSSSTHLPLPHAQAGRAYGRRHSVGPERPPHDSAVALPEEPLNRTIHKSAPDSRGRSKGKGKEKLFADIDRPIDDPCPSFDFPSQALSSDPSPNFLLSHPPRHPVFHNLPTVDSASSEENEQSHRLHAIPQIIHTPPTPQRQGDDIGLPSPASKSLAIAHREQILVSSSDTHHTPKGRFTPRFLSASKAVGSNEQKSSRRSPATSHDGPPHKTSGSSRNITSHRGKLGSFDFERPVSALNKSTSAIDQQKTDNAKARLFSLERTMSNDSARGGKSCPVPMSMPDQFGSTSVISFSSVSLQTKSTGKDTGNNTPVGQSSSWGRASGRRVLRTSHGTFAFEHPSSLPSSPNPHSFNLPHEASQNEDATSPPQSQFTTPSHAIFDARAKHSRGQDEPSPNPGERKPKGKGRSLDLGLGLSWAPSRLREEVLMPGMILARQKAKVDKNKTNGLDVTKTFENLLSESQFQTFKNYVRRFDAHAIPLKGPFGLLACIDTLLAEAGLGEREKSKLVTEFSVFVESLGG